MPATTAITTVHRFMKVGDRRAQPVS